MFPHIVKINDKFVVRTWRIIDFAGMVLRPNRTYWWGSWTSDDWTKFSTPEEAREAYKNRPRYNEPKRSKKFYGFI